jgi:transcriptional regulator with XRE-family HTH domain
MAKPAFREKYDEMAIEHHIGRVLHAARELQGLSQADVAERMRTTQQVVSRLESAMYYAHSLKSLMRYMEALHAVMEIRVRPMRPEETAPMLAFLDDKGSRKREVTAVD